MNTRRPSARPRSLIRHLLMASLLANLCGIYGVVNVVQGRGGIAYLKAYLRKDPNANIDQFAVMLEDLFRTLLSPGPQAIVFLGDSLTSACEWHELFGNNLTILNRGIGGDTSAGVLKRIPTVAVLRPAAVFLMIGTNDAQALGYAPADTMRNYLAHPRGPTKVLAWHAHLCREPSPLAIAEVQQVERRSQSRHTPTCEWRLRNVRRFEAPIPRL